MIMDNSKDASILIVDDEQSIRDILFRKLENSGYDCTVASDGISSLNKLKTYEADLVLLDISMPGKSGVDVLKEIKSKYEDTAVIMVTAIAELETAINTMKMGAYDYILKPIDLNTLIISIDKALEKRRLIIENKSYQHHLEEKVKDQTVQIREAFLNSIKALADALEAKDEYTSGHSQRVTEIAVAIAKEMSLPKQTIEQIMLAGLLHDIGKIGVRESILNKPSSLTKEEFQHVKLHCDIGVRILVNLIEDEEILSMVGHHHERFDGNGYPDGLKRDQIPVGAKILAVADSYDAMTSERPYRQAMTTEKALEEIECCRGSQFDPDVVNAFITAGKNIAAIV